MKTISIICMFCTLSRLITIASFLLASPRNLEADDSKPGKVESKVTPIVTKSVSTEEPKDEVGFYYLKGKQKILEGKTLEALPFLEKALEQDGKNAYLNHQLAQIYLQVNNFEKAESCAKIAVEVDPKNVEFRTTYGGVLASSKKFKEAKEQYQAVMELEPNHAKAPLFIGILEAEGGESQKAIKTFSTLIEKNPDSSMSYFYRAKIYLELDKIEEAKVDLEKCLTLRPSFIEAGTALGLIYERLNENDKAIATYSRIQGTGQFKKRLANLYLQKNELDKALEELIEYQTSTPDDYTVRTKIGLILFEQKKFKEAKGQLSSVLKEQPDGENVRFYLGWAHEELKEWDKALTQFRKVTKDSNLFREAMFHVGLIYKEQNRYAEGLKFAKELSKKNPDVSEFYELVANFYELAQDYKKALAEVQVGIAKAKSEEQEKLLYFEGALYDKLGEKKTAIEKMKSIVAKNENNAHALNFLGYTYADTGENLDEALGYIEKAMKLKPGDGYIEDSLGWVYFKKGNITKAEEHLENARKLQPDEAIILEHLGDLYTSKNEVGKAEELYKKAVVLLAKKDKATTKKIQSKLAQISKEKRVPSAVEKK